MIALNQKYRVLIFFVLNCSLGLVSPVRSIGAESSPDPVKLLQGVESVRLQIPSSSLKLKVFFRDSLVTNETIRTVDFDGDHRGFDAVSESANTVNYQTIFDGERAICYDEGNLNQISYRTINDQISMKLFDPRIIGISSYYNWADSIQNNLPYRFVPSKIELIGRERVGDLLAWHVRLANLDPSGKSYITDYWIDDTKGFRVYRMDFNGVQTYSYYENENYLWLPSRVVVKEFQGSQDGIRTQVAERGLEILEAKANVKFSKARWTLSGMRIKPGTDVIDWNLSKSIGTWDGKRLVRSSPDQYVRPMGVWGYLLCVILLGLPIVIFWLSKRNTSKGSHS